MSIILVLKLSIYKEYFLACCIYTNNIYLYAIFKELYKLQLTSYCVVNFATLLLMYRNTLWCSLLHFLALLITSNLLSYHLVPQN